MVDTLIDKETKAINEINVLVSYFTLPAFDKEDFGIK